MSEDLLVEVLLDEGSLLMGVPELVVAVVVELEPVGVAGVAPKNWNCLL